MIAAEDNKAVVYRTIDAVNRGDLDIIDELFSPDCIIHNPGGVTLDRAGHKRNLALLAQGFPDIYCSAEAVVAEGDLVAARQTLTGTHRGEVQGVPPTGKQVNYTAMGFIRVSDGKVVEVWHEVDTLGLLQQLGLAPAPQRPPA